LKKVGEKIGNREEKNKTNKKAHHCCLSWAILEGKMVATSSCSLCELRKRGQCKGQDRKSIEKKINEKTRE
jgi:hypothetical protein